MSRYTIHFFDKTIHVTKHILTTMSIFRSSQWQKTNETSGKVTQQKCEPKRIYAAKRERERGKKNTVDQCYREENEWKQEIKCTNEWHYAPLLRKYITEALRKSMIAKDLMEVINLYFWKGKKDSCSHQK